MTASYLHFKSVTLQNFRSVGNSPITVQLDKSTSTLVTGDNGSGKSTTTIIALAYVLFNKSYTKTKLPMLVNSINNKKCVVTVEFTTNGKEYKVVRGMKPSIFEIYEDGELVKSEAASKDYQSYLEGILGMTYKVFTQVVVLNREQYQPFMTLSKPDRRYIVEQLLNIDIFTKMNEVVKKRIKDVATEMYDVDHKIDLAEKDIQKLQAIIDTASAMTDDAIAKKQENIDALTQAQQKLTADIAEITTTTKTLIEKTRSFDYSSAELIHLIGDIKSELAVHKNNVTSERSKVSFFEQSNCPTCTQPIDEQLLHTVKTNSNKIITECAANAKTLLQRLVELQDTQTQQNEVMNALSVSQDKYKQVQMEINAKQVQIDSFNREISNLRCTQRDISKENDELTVCIANKEKLQGTYTELNTTHKRLTDLVSYLKEDGIKTTIIRQYLPFINKSINGFLSDMDFYINFILDEEFGEQVLVPGKKDFQYENFSTGQRSRIDLAILLTWLRIAQAKNSVNTNLLILDEVLENLDAQGVKDAVELFRTNYTDLNLFVISQRRDEFMNLFRSNIHYGTDQTGFTVIK